MTSILLVTISTENANDLLALLPGTQLHFDTHSSVRRQLRWPTLHRWKRSGCLRTPRQPGLWDKREPQSTSYCYLLGRSLQLRLLPPVLITL